ncbi:hypothetical protein [Agathobacter sp.]
MEENIENTKRKIMDKLPQILPKVVKSVVVHIVMLVYHVSMPPWVTAIKIKKAINPNDNADGKKDDRYMKKEE